jgi:ketosteroid isomerase-like protein
VDGILADSYVWTDEEGGYHNKTATLATLKSPDYNGSLRTANHQVFVYGDAAVVTGSAEQKGSIKGKPIASKIRFTDVFVKQNGTWKQVASHASAVK